MRPTKHVPNSPLPVLVYRSVLSPPYSEQSAVEALERNEWVHGGTFKHYPSHHFHSITHECYAVYKGSTRFLFGKGPLDEDVQGIEVELQAGDVIVDPAGVAHCNLDSSPDFEYIGVYPKGSPHWDNNFCKAESAETAEKARNARNVPIPETDPVYGRGGPLVEMWTKAAAASAVSG